MNREEVPDGSAEGSRCEDRAGSFASADSTDSFPIVGVGASAGGLAAFTEFLRSLPDDTGMAFVLIQHLEPSHASYLSKALAKATKRAVEEIRDGMQIKPDHVYAIPSGADVGISNGTLRLQSRQTGEGQLHLPIDQFLTALAADRGGQAIGVVLTGTGSDGAEGLRAIKSGGGVTFAQESTSAEFRGMPDAAVATGAVDVVLPIPDLARELVRIGHDPFFRGETLESQPDEPALRQVLAQLRKEVGVDFSGYKLASIRRRVARRMALHRLTELPAYLHRLREDKEEARALFDDLLIHVTSFFRDAETFAELKRLVFPELLKKKRDDGIIRIWCAGCSTGEEAYSLVIALLEFLEEENADSVEVRLFGTDISERAIERARTGVYSTESMRNVSAKRLDRFFTKVEAGYRINKNVRSSCAFVRHDLNADPPFSRMDLVSCRNVLIYFGAEMQKRALATFQFALNQPGFLLLGLAENVTEGAELFSPIDPEYKIFERVAGKSMLRFAPARPSSPRGWHTEEPRAKALTSIERVRRVENLLLDRYAPPGVIIDDGMEILRFRGRTGSFLEPAPGVPKHDLLKMARTGLAADLILAISQAREEEKVVRRPGVRVEDEGTEGVWDLVVVPAPFVSETEEPLYAVLFEAPDTGGLAADGGQATTPTRRDDDERVRKLEDEIKVTHERLRAIIEEHQRTNEELMSANEELTSSNEELQSLNEELRTTQEELQSTNEELTTLNEELRVRQIELDLVNSDLLNVLGSVEIPIVIVDRGRRIRRYTPMARSVLNLLPSDIGRPIDDIKPNLPIEDFDRRIAEVIDTATVQEEEVQGLNGRWYRLQLRPYKNADQEVDGAVISIIDIDALKRAVGVAEEARDSAREGEAERARLLELAKVARASAEAANRTKDLFLATLSHELRTPLSSLLMQSQMLLRGKMDEAKVRAAAEAIERATRAQAQLVDDLLDVARIESGKLQIDLQEVTLPAVVETAAATIQQSARRKGVEVELRLDQNLPSVSADPHRLQQVVLNLLTNAIKFTPKGGRIRVTVDAEGAMGRIQVKDTGVGIDPEFLPHIFEQFSQQDRESMRAHGGLGLGLSIVKHLVEIHGGTIQAQSGAAGEGATFTVRIPLLETSGGQEN